MDYDNLPTGSLWSPFSPAIVLLLGRRRLERSVVRGRSARREGANEVLGCSAQSLTGII